MIQTELLYELYDSCKQAIEDKNRALVLAEGFHWYQIARGDMK